MLSVMGILLFLLLILGCCFYCCPNSCRCLIGDCATNRIKSELSSQEDLKIVSVRDTDGHIISAASAIDILKRNHVKTYPLMQTDGEEPSPKPSVLLTPVSTTGHNGQQLASSLASRLPYSIAPEPSSNLSLFVRQMSTTSGESFNGAYRRPSVGPMPGDEEALNNQKDNALMSKVISAMTPLESPQRGESKPFSEKKEESPARTESVQSHDTTASKKSFSSPYPRPIYLRDPPVRSDIFSIPVDEPTDDELDCTPDCRVHIGHPTPPEISLPPSSPPKTQHQEDTTYNESFSENIGFLNLAVQQLLQKEIRFKNSSLIVDSDSETDSTTTRIYLHDTDSGEIPLPETPTKDSNSQQEKTEYPVHSSASDSDLNKVIIPLNALSEEETSRSTLRKMDDDSNPSTSSSEQPSNSRRQSISMAELTKFDLERPKRNAMMYDDRFNITTTSI